MYSLGFQDEPSFGVIDHSDAVCFTSVFSLDPYSEEMEAPRNEVPYSKLPHTKARSWA